jgi:hypothetical protein
MKQFLRYQISGIVFILWAIVFFYGKDAHNLNELNDLLYSSLKDLKIIAGLAIALPIGVIIHQLSVIIKNCLIAKIWEEFSDFPQKDIILSLNKEEKENSTEYCLQRISNLNSFYYVRFDNGFLSPFIAWVMVHCFMGRSINQAWIWSAIVISIFTMIYLKKIYCEIKEYNNILNESI